MDQLYLPGAQSRIQQIHVAFLQLSSIRSRLQAQPKPILLSGEYEEATERITDEQVVYPLRSPASEADMRSGNSVGLSNQTMAHYHFLVTYLSGQLDSNVRM